MADYSDQVVETSKSYTFNYEGNDNVSLSKFYATKKKPLNVTLNNTAEGTKTFDSSHNYAETISVTGGKYTLYINGTDSNKTVKLGNTTDNNVHLNNIGKNTVSAGDGGNDFYTGGAYANNTITAGKGKDDYNLNSGTTKITDKGGQNKYYINGGLNSITDKGSEGSTFNIYHELSKDGGTTTIKAGDGVDTLNVYNEKNPDNPQMITADLGKGNDIVYVQYRHPDATDNVDASIIDVKTGKGADYVEIWAGKKNTIDTGKDGDTVRIYKGGINFISTGDGEDDISTSNETEITTTSTIKAGNGNDEINISGGTNIIYGESGTDEITLFGGTNTLYGGNDNIELRGGENLVYTSADFVAISNGENTIYTQKGGSKIFANGGTNEIHSEKNKNYISLTNGTNTVYGGKGDTINANATSADNTIYANSDTINLYAGNNTIYTEKGGNKINILSSEIFTPNDDNIIYLQKGDNSVSMKGGESTDYNTAEITISAGKNTINLDEYTALELFSNNGLNTTQTVTIKGHAYASGQLGSGSDIIRDTSDADVPNGWKILAIEGNDKFYVSNGTNKQLYGGDGNDYFEITNGSGYEIYGNRDNDTIILKSGDSHSVFGGDGNDTINVNGGTNYNIKGEAGKDTFKITGGSGSKIYGGDDNDTFTITGGNGGRIYGGEGNDIFNIKGGVTNFIYGDNGDDIYNLNMKSGIAIIEDDAGKNTVNVAKNFKGSASVMETGTAEIDLVFDKSYKLTTSANVKNGVIKTNDSNITLYRNFSKTGDFVDGWGMQLITNIKDEISDKSINGRFIDIGYGAGTPNLNVGGKNYTLNLDQLKSDLVAWFSQEAHSGYADSAAVFSGKNTTDIQSLMAIYTADTKGCFVKA